MTRKVAPSRRVRREKKRRPRGVRASRVLPTVQEVREVGGEAELAALAGGLASHPETGPPLTGGDVDADWTRAHLSGEEAVGGSVATPDQDIVDELGRALGVEQGLDAEVRTSEEILRDRDRLRWHLERTAADKETKEEKEEKEEGETTE
jgi:hypothetical protein